MRRPVLMFLTLLTFLITMLPASAAPRARPGITERVSVTGLPPGAHEVWARACLGDLCGTRSVPVALS